MDNKITISVGGIIVVLIAIFIGYLLGRSSVETPKSKTEIVVKWEKGDTIRDTIKVLEPYEVKVPDSILVFMPTDTAKLFAIWKDYYLQRKYNLDFSNDSSGTFKVDAVVSQTNSLLPLLSLNLIYARFMKNKLFTKFLRYNFMV